MAEATTITATGAALTVAGLATGLPPELIIPAFIGALWSIRAARQTSVISRLWQVTTGTLFGAWSAKSAVAFATGMWPAVSAAADLKYPAAFAVGFFGLKLLDAWGRSRLREEAGK